MTLQTVGLQTHKWNNDIKSALFLLLYPAIITTSYMAVTAVVLLDILYMHARGGYHFAFGQVFHEIIVHWYVPYGLAFAFLGFVYYCNLNQLNIPPEEQFADPHRRQALHTMLETLCISRGMEKPFLFIRKDSSINAYTTGLTTDTYKIVITTGLLRKMDNEALETVLAHELTHIMTGDTRLLFLTTTFSNMLRTLGDHAWPSENTRRSLPEEFVASQAGIFMMMLGAVMKLTNIGAMFAACFLSRSRDLVADAGAIELTKNPQALIKALNIAGSNLCGFYKEDDIKPVLFHYKRGRDMCGHLHIADRIHAIRRFMPGS